ncbi:c-type cytochrome [Caulobacter segnis]
MFDRMEKGQINGRVCWTSRPAREAGGRPAGRRRAEAWSPFRPWPARPRPATAPAAARCWSRRRHAARDGTALCSDAPPFASLYARWSACGGLAAILEEGMLARGSRLEEGAPRSHPRMPMTQLDDDQRADLEAYLRSLDPRSPAAPRPRL